MLKFVRIAAALFCALLLASCQSSLQPSGFLGKDDARMSENKELPFSRSWKNPAAKLNTYSQIVVKPMRVDGLPPLPNRSRTKVQNVGGAYDRDVVSLALEGTEKMRNELGRSPNRRVSIANKVGRKSDLMILETNLIEIRPSRPRAQIKKSLLPFVSYFGRPSLGLEGRLIDARTGTTLFAFSDLERGEISLLDLQKLTYHGVHRRELGTWAKQIRQVVEGNGADLVRDPFLIQPVNW